MLNKGESLNSVTTKEFLNNISKLLFSRAILIMLPNWDKVSGVVPDLEIIINPVVFESRFIISFEKNNGSILSKKKIFLGCSIRVLIKARAPRFDPPVPTQQNFFYFLNFLVCSIV